MLHFNIQALLDARGKTRYWLVKKLDTTYVTVNSLCDDRSKSVRLSTLEKLMKAFECSIEDLFYVDDQNSDKISES